MPLKQARCVFSALAFFRHPRAAAAQAPKLPRARMRMRYSSSANTDARPPPEFPYTRVHDPVLLDEVIGLLEPRKGALYLDGTFGEGGYTKRILDHAACNVVAIDQDPSAIDKATKLAELYPGRLSTQWCDFAKIGALGRTFDGIVLDIGLSSGQLASDRGFSFQTDSPLDMRMSTTAAHGSLRRLIPADVVVNQFSGDKLATIFRELGQERFSRQIARGIEKARAKQPLKTTKQLADVILASIPKRCIYEARIHPATRVFQSLRIYVNDELGQLRSALDSATAILNPGGRLVVVSFHSLEDTIVKKYFRTLTQPAEMDVDMDMVLDSSVGDDEYDLAADMGPAFRLLTKKAVAPSADEVERNPRSRSAKLRAIERIGVQV
ncbi:hypothetical protein GGI07_004083 [Coemansia sp. Benny D115]|nr:hypothetical protein GGI07_004083 [Coemansia sp. Benny D115]